MPLAHEVQIKAVRGVTAVAPFGIVIGTYQRPNNPMIIIGTDFDAMLKIGSDMMVAPHQAAAMRRTRNGVIVGVTTMKQYGWKVGDRIPVSGITPKADGASDWQFDIVGTYTLQQPDWATRIFANYDFINEALSTGKNQSVLFYVGISDPAKSAAISQAIDDRFANSPDQTNTANEKDATETALGQIGNYSLLINLVCGAVHVHAAVPDRQYHGAVGARAHRGAGGAEDPRLHGCGRAMAGLGRSLTLAMVAAAWAWRWPRGYCPG